jgi:UDP-glucose 4-epimerase
MSSKPRVLVTGGAGYIGSHAVSGLLHAGYQVTVLDSLVKGHPQAVHPDARLVVGDCGDRALLKSLFQEETFEAVMHFAAFIEIDGSMRDPALFFANNTAATLLLLEAMLQAGIGKFIFSSTAATFGASQYLPIDEAHPQAPTNPYGQSKLLVEQALNWIHDLRGLRYASFRYFNAAGCSETLGEDHHPETHIIPLVLDVALGRRDCIRIYGTDYPTPDGTCIRDFIHVEDLAAAHLLALDALDRESRMVFNLGTEKGFSVREVIAAARRVTGHPIPVVEEGRRAGDPAVLVASSAKIRRELGWVPRMPDLESIIRTAWDWRRKFPEGYGQV